MSNTNKQYRNGGVSPSHSKNHRDRSKSGGYGQRHRRNEHHNMHHSHRDNRDHQKYESSRDRNQSHKKADQKYQSSYQKVNGGHKSKNALQYHENSMTNKRSEQKQHEQINGLSTRNNVPKMTMKDIEENNFQAPSYGSSSYYEGQKLSPLFEEPQRNERQNGTLGNGNAGKNKIQVQGHQTQQIKSQSRSLLQTDQMQNISTKPVASVINNEDLASNLNSNFVNPQISKSKDSNVDTRNKLTEISFAHKLQVIGICPSFGLQNSGPQLALMRLDMIDLSLNKAKRHFGTVIDPSNIERSLEEIFQESRLQSSARHKYIKFLSFLQRTMRNLRKDCLSDQNLKNQFVGVLKRTMANPAMAGADNADMRRKLREIVEEANQRESANEDLPSIQDEERKERLQKQFEKFIPQQSSQPDKEGDKYLLTQHLSQPERAEAHLAETSQKLADADNSVQQDQKQSFLQSPPAKKKKESQPLSWDNDENSEDGQLDDDQCEKSTSEKPDFNPPKSNKIPNIGHKRDSPESQSNFLFFDKHLQKKQKSELEDKEQPNLKDQNSQSSIRQNASSDHNRDSERMENTNCDKQKNEFTKNTESRSYHIPSKSDESGNDQMQRKGNEGNNVESPNNFSFVDSLRVQKDRLSSQTSLKQPLVGTQTELSQKSRGLNDDEHMQEQASINNNEAINEENSRMQEEGDQSRTISNTSSQLSHTQGQFPVDLPQFNKSMFKDVLLNAETDLLGMMMAAEEQELQQIKNV